METKLTILKSSPIVNLRQEIAAKEIEARRYFEGGYSVFNAQYLEAILRNTTNFTCYDFRVLLAIKSATFKNDLKTKILYELLGTKHFSREQIKAAQAKFVAFLKDVSAEDALSKEMRHAKLPNIPLRSLAMNGTRLEMIVFLFGCSKMRRGRRMMFTLPRKYLARMFHSTSWRVTKAIRSLEARGLLVACWTSKEDRQTKGFFYTWCCNNYLPEIRRYYAKKKIRVIEPVNKSTASSLT